MPDFDLYFYNLKHPIMRFHSTEYLEEDASSSIPAITTDPTVNDDLSRGFSEGSMWINTNSQTVWACVDPTIANASWLQLGNSN